MKIQDCIREHASPYDQQLVDNCKWYDEEGTIRRTLLNAYSKGDSKAVIKLAKYAATGSFHGDDSENLKVIRDLIPKTATTTMQTKLIKAEETIRARIWRDRGFSDNDWEYD